MAIDFSKRFIIVSGTKVEIDTKTDMMISDISDDMDRVAASMAWWSSVWAEAESEHVRLDAAYRAWRGRKTAAIDGKLPEWKAKAAIEADPEFLSHKGEIARAEGNIIAARGQFDSFDKKANALQSKGAMVRQEKGAIGLHTPVTPRSAPRESPPVEGGAPHVPMRVKSHKKSLADD